MGRPKLYTEEEKVEALRAKCRRYSKTPMGRAHILAENYFKKDKKYGLVKEEKPPNYVTSKWIYDNILFKICPYCGKSDWKIMGCNRIDDFKPHTIDNVEPCCKDCNPKQPRPTGRKSKPKMWISVDQIDPISGDVIRHWKSASEAEDVCGFLHSKISDCCNGKRKTHGGFIWRKHKREDAN